MLLSKERRREIDAIDDLLMSYDVSFPENSVGDLLDKMEIPYSGAAELPEGVCGVIFRRDDRPLYSGK